MAVADVPVPPLAVRSGFETLTDTLTASGLCFEFSKVGCHDLLADRIVGSGLIHQEGTVVNSFHGLFAHVPIISMGWGRSVDHVVHLICWHTGDGVTADLGGVWTPLLNRLIHYSIVLTIHPLGCLALTFFPKEDDRMLGRFVEVDLNLIERKVAFG